MKLIQCTECHSNNIKYFEKRKSYTCMDCGCSFTEKEFNKLRIFLSYGHDHNEELVRMIKADMDFNYIGIKYISFDDNVIYYF